MNKWKLRVRGFTSRPHAERSVFVGRPWSWKINGMVKLKSMPLSNLSGPHTHTDNLMNDHNNLHLPCGDPSSISAGEKMMTDNGINKAGGSDLSAHQL